MKSSTKSCLTAGVAVMGASVIAASPIAPLPDNSALQHRTQEVALLANVQPQAQNAEVQDLLAAFDPIAALRAFIEGTLLAYERPGPVPYTPVAGVGDGLSRLGQGFIASGMRLGEASIITPIRFIQLFGPSALGRGGEVSSEFITNLIDGPLWVADPILYAFRDALPAPLGGPGGMVETFRNEMWKLTEELNATWEDIDGAIGNFITNTLIAFERPGPVPYSPATGPIDGLVGMTQGFIATGMRLVATAVITPIRFVELLGPIAQGNGAQAISNLITNLVDGPLWVADPALYGLRDALPAPFGGPGALVENLRNGIWEGTERINAAIESIFGLPPANPAQESTELRIDPDASDKSFVGPSASRLPDPKAQLVNLPGEEEAEPEAPQEPAPEEESESTDDGTAPEVDPVDEVDEAPEVDPESTDEAPEEEPESTDEAPEVDPESTDEAPEVDPESTDDEKESPASNLVRPSPNFSPNAPSTGGAGSNGTSEGENSGDEDTEKSDNPAPPKGTEPTGGNVNTPADSGPEKSADKAPSGDNDE